MVEDIVNCILYKPSYDLNTTNYGSPFHYSDILSRWSCAPGWQAGSETGWVYFFNSEVTSPLSNSSSSKPNFSLFVNAAIFNRVA